jgi:hypothetical protein
MLRPLLLVSLSALALAPAGCSDDPEPPTAPVPTVLADTGRSIDGLLQVGDHLYWTDWARDDSSVPVQVRSLRIGDAESALIATVDEFFVRVVAADPATDAVIWTQGSDDHQLWIAEGAAVRQLPVGGVHAALDATTIYSERATAAGIEVLGTPRAGGEPTVLSTIPGEGLEPVGLMLDPAHVSLILVVNNGDDGSVWRVSVTGGEPVPVATLTSDLAGQTSEDVWTAMVVDHDALLVPTRVEGLFRVPLSGGPPVRLGFGTNADAVVVIDDRIYWSGGDRINREEELLGTSYTTDELATYDGSLIWVWDDQLLSLDAAQFEPALIP